MFSIEKLYLYLGMATFWAIWGLGLVFIAQHALKVIGF